MPGQTNNNNGSSHQRLRFAVIGGGISGLAAAYQLYTETRSMSPSPEIYLFEGSPRVGGCISTYNLDDTILELGPDAFITEKPAALELCRKLGIEDRLISTSEKNRRTFVAHNNKLYPLPDGFLMMAPTQILPLLKSPLFSWKAKLRMFMELFTPAAPAGLSDESLAQFVRRRLGSEVLDKVVQPLVGGIYTADPERLSIRAALPRISQIEQKYGSLIKGLSAGQKARQESGARYGLFVTLDQGMSVLVHSLASQLGSIIHTHTLVSRVRRKEANWELELFDGRRTEVSGVVVATSAFHAADILADLDPALSLDLGSIEYASSAVLNLIYKKGDIPHPLDGFGFVVPATEKRTMIACSFNSVKWQGRAPEDKVLLRVFVGGALQPDVYALADEEIECLIWEDLHTYLGIKALPLLSVISRYPRSMPQYNVGHIALRERIEQTLAQYPGLVLAGNAYYGVGIPDCIASGQRAADQILDRAKMSTKNVNTGILP